MYGKYENNFQHVNKEDENEDVDIIYSVNNALIFIIYEKFIENNRRHKTNTIGGGFRCEQ